MSDALADKLRMSRTSLAEVVIMMTVVMTILMTAMMTGNDEDVVDGKLLIAIANITVVLIAKEGK